MIKITDEPDQDKLPGLVAKEVHRVLAQFDEVIKAHGSTPPAVSACSITATDPLGQKAVCDDLAGLVSELVHWLAVEAARRLSAGADEAPAFSVPIECEPSLEAGRVVAEAGDQQPEFMRIEDWAGQVAGSTYLQKRFGIPRSTLNWWQRHNHVIALRKGPGKHVFPLSQFIDGRPAPGIRQVLISINNRREAWLWLIQPCPLLEGRVPLQMLRQDLVAEVVLAAQRVSST